MSIILNLDALSHQGSGGFVIGMLPTLTKMFYCCTYAVPGFRLPDDDKK